MLIVGFCGGLALAGCGADDDPARDGMAASKAPAVDPVPGNPPRRLVVTDLEEGSGSRVGPGDEVSIEFTMVRYAPREPVDGNLDGPPRRFVLGAGTEIPGWEKGLVGMRVGGRRKLVVPPRLIFPESGPEDTMVYVVDLLAAN